MPGNAVLTVPVPVSAWSKISTALKRIAQISAISAALRISAERGTAASWAGDVDGTFVEFNFLNVQF